MQSTIYVQMADGKTVDDLHQHLAHTYKVGPARSAVSSLVVHHFVFDMVHQALQQACTLASLIETGVLSWREESLSY